MAVPRSNTTVRPVASTINPRPPAPGVNTRVSPGSVPGRKKRYPVGAPARAIILKPNTPAFVPGLLDAAGLRKAGQLGTEYQTGTASAGSALQTAMNQLRMRELGNEEQLTQGLIGADNNAAARGIFRSGIRAGNRSEVANEAQRQFDEIRAMKEAAALNAEREQGLRDATYQTNLGDITAESDDRRYSDYLKNQAMLPGPQKMKIFTYSQWLNYMKNKPRNSSNPLAGATKDDLSRIYQEYVDGQTRIYRKKWGLD